LESTKTQKMAYPCIWLESGAKEAADYYISIFPNSKLLSNNPMATVFELDGQRYMTLNGATENAFNDGISFVITCETQAEIDHYWNAFTKEGKESKCGWCRYKYGVAWQVLPAQLGKWMSNPQTAPKAMYAFMQMKKFDIAVMEAAVNG
jgi:predicted 3-demethylubiquinone-9 3-methyltransferase (glyoxalase superfamily)